jgi:hypothetical protein
MKIKLTENNQTAHSKLGRIIILFKTNNKKNKGKKEKII